MLGLFMPVLSSSWADGPDSPRVRLRGVQRGHGSTEELGEACAAESSNDDSGAGTPRVGVCAACQQVCAAPWK